jgi:hypothetical protein
MMDRALIVSIVGLALSVLYQAVTIGTWRGRVDADREQLRQLISEALAELRSMRQELHTRDLANRNDFASAASVLALSDKTDNRITELWGAVDRLRHEKQEKADCRLRHD